MQVRARSGTRVGSEQMHEGLSLHYYHRGILLIRSGFVFEIENSVLLLAGKAGPNHWLAAASLFRRMGRQVSNCLDPVASSLYDKPCFRSGLYVNDVYQIFPRSTNIRCKERIRPTRYYKFGVTRTASGEVTLYLNGGICVGGKPGVSENLVLDPKDIVFFHDDGSENPSGEVRIVCFRVFVHRIEVEK